jgi:hypothetical protein
MKRIVTTILAALATFAFEGCATNQIVPKPSKITFQDALKSIGAGLREMNKAEGNFRTGLIPSGATVTFNVTAAASDTNGLYVTASVPLQTTTIGGGVNTASSTTASRANTITLTFTNILERIS